MPATQTATEADPIAEARADDAPISARVIDKIRVQRRKTEGHHAAVMARTEECQSLRQRAGRLKSSIAELLDSWEFKQSQREVKSEYLFPRDEKNPPPPAPGTEKTPKSTLEMAQFEHDLETTGAELLIATAAQITASERWEVEKHVLDSWESAIRRLGPAARAALDSMPAPGATMNAPASWVDFRLTSHGIAAAQKT